MLDTVQTESSGVSDGVSSDLIRNTVVVLRNLLSRGTEIAAYMPWLYVGAIVLESAVVLKSAAEMHAVPSPGAQQLTSLPVRTRSHSRLMSLNFLTMSVRNIVLRIVVEPYVVLGPGARCSTTSLVRVNALWVPLAWLESRPLCSRTSLCRFAFPRPDEEVSQRNHPVRIITLPDPVLRDRIGRSKAVVVLQHVEVLGEGGENALPEREDHDRGSMAGNEDPAESLDNVCISPRRLVRGCRPSGVDREPRRKKPRLTLIRYEASPVPASSPSTWNVVGIPSSETNSCLGTGSDGASRLAEGAGEAVAVATPAVFGGVIEGTDGAVMSGRAIADSMGLRGVWGGVGRRRGWERGPSPSRVTNAAALGSRSSDTEDATSVLPPGWTLSSPGEPSAHGGKPSNASSICSTLISTSTGRVLTRIGGGGWEYSTRRRSHRS
jgi:hypothetical protein